MRAEVPTPYARPYWKEKHDLPNSDLGYLTTIEYEPGRLFLCHYGQHDDGVTCVQGTYVSLAR